MNYYYRPTRAQGRRQTLRLTRPAAATRFHRCRFASCRPSRDTATGAAPATRRTSSSRSDPPGWTHPVNVSGGLVSKRHPLGATGLAKHVRGHHTSARGGRRPAGRRCRTRHDARRPRIVLCGPYSGTTGRIVDTRSAVRQLAGVTAPDTFSILGPERVDFAPHWRRSRPSLRTYQLANAACSAPHCRAKKLCATGVLEAMMSNPWKAPSTTSSSQLTPASRSLCAYSTSWP